MHACFVVFFKPAVRTTALSVQYLWLDWPEQTNLNRSVAVLESPTYQWRELPQVSFMLRQKFCHDKHVFVATNMFVATKHVFCCDKTRLLSRKLPIFLLWGTRLLLRQNFFRDKLTFLATKSFEVTKVCSSRAKFCRDKHMCQTDMLHVVTHKLWSHLLQGWVSIISIIGESCHKYNFCHVFLSRQKYARRDKTFVTFCRNKS